MFRILFVKVRCLRQSQDRPYRLYHLSRRGILVVRAVLLVLVYLVCQERRLFRLFHHDHLDQDDQCLLCHLLVHARRVVHGFLVFLEDLVDQDHPFHHEDQQDLEYLARRAHPEDQLGLEDPQDQ